MRTSIENLLRGGGAKSATLVIGRREQSGRRNEAVK